MSVAFNEVRLTRKGITFDDIVLPGAAVGTEARVDRYGPDLHKVTFSVYTQSVDIAPDPMYGCNVEVHDHDEANQ
ncbi:hypothetical protein GCM10020360_31720 [Nonlabens tegetincola]